MDLVNATPLPAKLMTSEIAGVPGRIGVIAAKATFQFDTRGHVTLDTQNPIGIFLKEENTELGMLPSDNVPRMDPAFEVIVLGAAYAPGGYAITHRRVSLAVGHVRRDLAVFGDRAWLVAAGARQITRPLPFVRMPLGPDRAFGGRCQVLIDHDTPIEVADPTNPYGRGFDPGPLARGLCSTLKAPAGFPQYDPMRALPNVENPAALISRWDDTPAPVFWATVPPTSGLHARRCLEVDESHNPPFGLLDTAHHRAHPDWVIPVPPEHSIVRLEGLTPEETVAFWLPALRVGVDYVVGARTGYRELAPQTMVLLPDQKRFYIVYRHRFTYGFGSGDERSMRLRLDHGWFQPPAHSTQETE